MKYVYLFVLLFLCLFSVIAQAKNNKSSDQEYLCKEIDKKTYCEDTKHSPLTGKLRTYYTNDKPKSIENYKRGFRDGLTTFFDSKGNKQERLYYNHGIKNGTDKIYYPNRNIKFSANYDNGLLNSLFEVYNLEGDLLGRMKYKQGVLLKGYCIENKKKKNISITELKEHKFNEMFTCGVK